VWAGDRLVVWGGLRWKRVDGGVMIDEPAKIQRAGLHSFSEDGHKGARFDYLLANPPF
jgi:hypothetical protein